MRADMDEVVIERPRHGHGRSYHQVRRAESRGDLEDLPTKRSMRRPFRQRYIDKDLSDLLGPLEGYLNSQIGRPWDKVYSDIRKNLNPNSTTQIHIVGHLTDMVAINVIRNSQGDLIEQGDRSPSRVRPGDLYVDPKSGLLLRNGQRIAKVDYHAIQQVEIAKIYRSFGEEKEAFKVNGIWYWATYSDVPPVEYYYALDENRNRIRLVHPRFQVEPNDLRVPQRIDWKGIVEYHDARRFSYGSAARYRSGKVQMSRDDLRKHGLGNAYMPTYRGRKG